MPKTVALSSPQSEPDQSRTFLEDSGHGLHWPRKVRELRNHHIDSTIWNDFAFRDDDIVIASYARSGTAWVQQIVSQLLLPGAEGLDVAAMSPWLNRRVPPKAVTLPAIEAQTHRRFLQTHLPVDALVYAPRPSTSTSAGTGVTWSGACATITSTTSGTGP